MADPIEFQTNNCQSDGRNSLKTIEFEFMRNKYEFVINPEVYDQMESARVTITQTKDGAWVDDFGAGLPTISIKGTTGFKDKDGNSNAGFLRFKELRDLIRRYYNKMPPGRTVNALYELVFHNFTDGEHWVVIPQVFALRRSISKPLLYAYEIQMTCIRPVYYLPGYTDWDGIGRLQPIIYT